MKYLSHILCLVLLAIGMQSCSDDESYMDSQAMEWLGSMRPVDAVLSADTLRILDIGNSYTEDATALLNGIAKAAGMDMSHVCYYRLVRGGASFFTWTQCYNGNDNTEYTFSRVLGDLSTTVAEGKYTNGSVFARILSEPWDVIVIHQVSQYATDYSQWKKNKENGCLPELLNIIRENNPDVLMASMLVHSYASNYKGNREHSSYLRWQHIVEAQEAMLNDYKAVRVVIPEGTAIENLRSAEYNTDGDLTIDGTHLGRGLARYTAACTVYQTLFAPRTQVSVEGNSYRYICSEAERKSFPDHCIDVDDANAPVAQCAAVRACEDWHNIKQITK